MDMREINQSVITEFRANEGKLSGPMEGAPILLLTTIGRTSGKPHTTPLGFIDHDEKLAIAAANGGADQDPDWFRNIQTNTNVTVEVPGATIPAIAAVLVDEQRESLLHQLTQTLPGMADHVAATNREIPVVLLQESSETGR